MLALKRNRLQGVIPSNKKSSQIRRCTWDGWQIALCRFAL